MLQLTTPGLLAQQVSPGSALCTGNRRAAMAPHGIYPAAGDEQWLALVVHSGPTFSALAQVLGRPDCAADPALQALAGRQQLEDDIDAAITTWARQHSAQQAADALQAAGIAAAPVVHVQHLADDADLARAGFSIDVERAVSGAQRQAGLAIVQNGQRLGARSPAPLLGEHSRAVLQARAAVGPEQFSALVRDGVVSFAPRPARNLVAAPGVAAARDAATPTATPTAAPAATPAATPTATPTAENP